MSKITIDKREMSSKEFELMKPGFNQHTLNDEVEIQSIYNWYSDGSRKIGLKKTG